MNTKKPIYLIDGKEVSKLRYQVLKAGKIKSYVDKRWCCCAAHPVAHMHSKEETV